MSSEVEALAGVGLCDCGAEDGYRQPGNWHGRSCPAYVPTGYLSPSEVVARDASVAAKVAEQIAQAIELVPVGTSGPQAVRNRCAKIARAAALRPGEGSEL